MVAAEHLQLKLTDTGCLKQFQPGFVRNVTHIQLHNSVLINTAYHLLSVVLQWTLVQQVNKVGNTHKFDVWLNVGTTIHFIDVHITRSRWSTEWAIKGHRSSQCGQDPIVHKFSFWWQVKFRDVL